MCIHIVLYYVIFIVLYCIILYYFNEILISNKCREVLFSTATWMSFNIVPSESNHTEYILYDPFIRNSRTGKTNLWWLKSAHWLPLDQWGWNGKGHDRNSRGDRNVLYFYWYFLLRRKMRLSKLIELHLKISLSPCIQILPQLKNPVCLAPMTNIFPAILGWISGKKLATGSLTTLKWGSALWRHNNGLLYQSEHKWASCL